MTILKTGYIAFNHTAWSALKLWKTAILYIKRIIFLYILKIFILKLEKCSLFYDHRTNRLSPLSFFKICFLATYKMQMNFTWLKNYCQEFWISLLDCPTPTYTITYLGIRCILIFITSMSYHKSMCVSSQNRVIDKCWLQQNSRRH